MKQERFKLFRLEKQWILYDVGNSAFILLVSTLLPIYFDYLADSAGVSAVDYLAYWGYATSAVTLIVMLLGPVLGTLADTRGFKKPIFAVSILFGTAGCAALGSTHSWLIFLVIFVMAKVCYSVSQILYDSMLSDITVPERMDVVSSHGFAWGYIGSCIPFAICLALVLGSGSFGLSMVTAMIISFCIIALWWLLMSIPLLKNYRQHHYVTHTGHAVSSSFARIFGTLKDIRGQKHIFLFLLAFFFYIDGVYTIIDMATAYGEALGLDSTGLLLALLVTQIVAFPTSILFGRLSAKYPSRNLITLCIAAYTGIAVFAFFMSTQVHFWILAVCVGLFQGGIQALSRSHFAKIIPAEKSGEYFGILDICGKGASFLGTTMVSVISQATNNINLGVGAIAILFVIGMILFRIASRPDTV